jgi:CheY-like chemotaxis protein
MKVLWVDDGIAALDRLAHGGFDLLITDVRLGRGGDGWSSAQLARQERPSLPVIFMTGDDRVTVRAGEQLLRKPCTLGKLEAAISRARTAG